MLENITIEIKRKILGPVVRNLDKGLSRDVLIILSEFSLQLVVRELDKFILVKLPC